MIYETYFDQQTYTITINKGRKILHDDWARGNFFYMKDFKCLNKALIDAKIKILKIKDV